MDRSWHGHEPSMLITAQVTADDFVSVWKVLPIG